MFFYDLLVVNKSVFFLLPQQRDGEEGCSHQLPVTGHAHERPGEPPGYGGRLQGPAAQVRKPLVSFPLIPGKKNIGI